MENIIVNVLSLGWSIFIAVLMTTAIILAAALLDAINGRGEK